MKIFILLVLLFFSQTEASGDLAEQDIFRPFTHSARKVDEIIASFLPDNDQVAMTHVNKYFNYVIHNSKSWYDIAEKSLGIKLPKNFYFFRIDYLPNCFRYTFKDMGAVSSDYTGLRLSDDRSTVVLTKWGRLQTPTTIIRNSRDIELEHCHANIVNVDGSIVAGWYSNTTVSGCRAFRWTAIKGLELLPLPAQRSIAFRITQRKEDDYIPVISGTITLKGQETIFHWQGDLVTVTNNQASISTKLDTLSTDEVISVRPVSCSCSWAFWKSSPARCEVGSESEEAIEDILEHQKILPKGLQLESVPSLSTDGVSMAGFGTRNGEKRIWIATIPRSHTPRPPQLSYFKQAQSAISDLVLQALSHVIFRVTKYRPLPI